jgi:hypothetical protein
MPLEILGPLVLVGIISAVVLARFVANTPPRLINTASQAQAILLNEFPSVVFGSKFMITKNGCEALIEIKEPANHLGLVHVMGSKHVARLLGAGDIRSITNNDPNDLVLNLKDLTLPKINLQFETDEQKDAALKLFENLKLSEAA